MANECFLCNPDPDLVYWSDSENIAMCGLGPILTGYSVVATRKHVRSATDAAAGEAPTFLAFASKARAKLEISFGQCLLAEHGRVPVCVDPSGTADPHCYHAHFLLFPGAPSIEEEAKTYFAKVRNVASLNQAMTIAAACNEYFLLSPTVQRFLVMTRPGRLIRQFVRLLVSEAMGVPELANWRIHSRREEAASMVYQLRTLFRGDKPC